MAQPETRAEVDADPKFVGVPDERPIPGLDPGERQPALHAHWLYQHVLQDLWDEREQRRQAADEAEAAEASAANALAGLAGGRPGPVVHLASPKLLEGAPKLISILLEKRMLPWVHTAAGGEAALHTRADKEHPLVLRPHSYQVNAPRRTGTTTIVVPREATGPHHGGTQYPAWFAACQFFLYLLRGSEFYQEGITKAADVVYLMMVALMTKAGLWGPFRRWVRNVRREDAVPVFPFERKGDPRGNMGKEKIWAWVFNGQALPPKEEVGPPLTAAERAELVRSLWGWVERPPGSEDEDEDEDEDEGDADEEEDSMVE